MKAKIPPPFDPKEQFDRVAVGKAVRLFRELGGLSQDALAEVAGVSQTAISNLERGVSFSEDSLNKIAQGLNVSVRELLNVSFEIQDPNSSIHESMVAFARMKRLFQEGLAEKEVAASARPFRPDREGAEAAAHFPTGVQAASATITRVVKQASPEQGPARRKPTART